MKGRVLIIDNDSDYSQRLREQLRALGYEVIAEQSSASGMRVAETFAPSVIITDTLPSGHDAFRALREIRTSQPHTPIILAGEQSSVETALRAIQEEGAYHYFDKPLDIEKLNVVLERAVELAEARRENELLRRQLRDRGAFGELVGSSDAMQQVYRLIEQVATSSASVLITGESGTGKELVARTIHTLSSRRDGPFSRSIARPFPTR
jgi:two-component system NtrC family response regulator